jgi:hypothetical protein
VANGPKLEAVTSGWTGIGAEMKNDFVAIASRAERR